MHGHFAEIFQISPSENFSATERAFFGSQAMWRCQSTKGRETVMFPVKKFLVVTLMSLVAIAGATPVFAAEAPAAEIALSETGSVDLEPVRAFDWVRPFDICRHDRLTDHPRCDHDRPSDIHPCRTDRLKDHPRCNPDIHPCRTDRLKDHPRCNPDDESNVHPDANPDVRPAARHAIRPARADKVDAVRVDR